MEFRRILAEFTVSILPAVCYALHIQRKPKGVFAMTCAIHTAEYRYFTFSFTYFGKAFRGLAESMRV